MIRTILVPSYGLPTDQAPLGVALSLARSFGAHLNVLHVHLDVGDLVLSISASDPSGGAAASGIIESMIRDADTCEATARQAFDAFCTREHVLETSSPMRQGATVGWVRNVGQEDRWLAAHGRVADLTVVGRMRGSAPSPIHVLEAALLQTGRPMLLVTSQSLAFFHGTVAIAWKDTPETARAVAAAMPFLERADHIVVLCADEGGERDQSGERLVQALRWHCRQVTLEHRPSGTKRPVELLLDAAAGLHATLLVMGGYGHSRVRELVFGGFTERVIRMADLPVLMAH